MYNVFAGRRGRDRKGEYGEGGESGERNLSYSRRSPFNWNNNTTAGEFVHGAKRERGARGSGGGEILIATILIGSNESLTVLLQWSVVPRSRYTQRNPENFSNADRAAKVRLAQTRARVLRRRRRQIYLSSVLLVRPSTPNPLHLGSCVRVHESYTRSTRARES